MYVWTNTTHVFWIFFGNDGDGDGALVSLEKGKQKQHKKTFSLFQYHYPGNFWIVLIQS